MINDSATFTPYAVGLCYASVCTNLADSEATERLNLVRPTGIEHGWVIADEPFSTGEPNPTPCPDDPSCRHILFWC